MFDNQNKAVKQKYGLLCLKRRDYDETAFYDWVINMIIIVCLFPNVHILEKNVLLKQDIHNRDHNDEKGIKGIQTRPSYDIKCIRMYKNMM